MCYNEYISACLVLLFKDTGMWREKERAREKDYFLWMHNSYKSSSEKQNLAAWIAIALPQCCISCVSLSLTHALLAPAL